MKRILMAGAASLLVASTTLAATDDQRLAETLVPLISKCMSVPDEAKTAGVKAVLEFKLDQGNLVGDPVVVSDLVTRAQKAMATAAINAVRRCSPYPGGVTLFLRVTFDPRDIIQ